MQIILGFIIAVVCFYTGYKLGKNHGFIELQEKKAQEFVKKVKRKYSKGEVFAPTEKSELEAWKKQQPDYDKGGEIVNKKFKLGR